MKIKERQATVIQGLKTQGYTLEAVHDLKILTMVSEGRWYLKALRGNAFKLFANYFFRSEEQMTAYRDKIVEYAVERIDYKAKQKLEKKSRLQALEVGQIFVSSWGYEQTNVDFYQITELVGISTAILMPIRSEMVDGTQGHDCSNVTAIKDAFVENAEPLKKRMNTSGGFTISTCQRASKWSGKAMYSSWYY